MTADRTTLALLLRIAALVACSAGHATAEQGARADPYACEGCEAVHERPADSLTSTARVAGPEEPGERLVATGTVFAADGKTPQEGVVIYLHQTNAAGLYANGTDESEWSRRNGRLRAWVRTDGQGRYRFETIKPAPYPDMTMPAHIHLMIGEPGRRPYYVDDIVFDGEFGVDAAYRQAQELRGGSGIVSLVRDSDGVLVARRDIVLERHP
ncbi:intradiol ring-cleavage dioxygenase [Altererythrobacter aerius]|uniref:Intradiol ring-cleavage dioxygenase n=1 Tax=Tsuneonella aeria TaxID=1837929 RepID=A0A6I4TGI8_9SPHN|nr:intradiol ring-cleavage dioxygenase [Tsuneonella aeria]MXO75717.1 intradiol ring-cleavage dioxygenase [Tsuneonella aeria]